MNWTLLAIILILLIAMGIGAAKGIIKMVFSVLVLLVAVIVTTAITPWLSNLLSKNTKWDDAVRKKVESYYEEHNLFMSQTSVPDLDSDNFPIMITDSIRDSAREYIDKGADKYNNFIVDATTNMIFRTMVYLGTFLVIFVLLKLLGMLLDVVSKLPVLNEINRVGGALVGIAAGLIGIWIFFIRITSTSSTKFAVEVSEQITDNKFLTFIYEKNPIQYFLLKLF